MADDAPVPLSKMIDAHVALLTKTNGVTKDERVYREGWPATVSLMGTSRKRFPLVIPVDRNIPLTAVADLARIGFSTVPSVYGDVPAVVAKSAPPRRYVICAQDGHGRFGKDLRAEIDGMAVDEMPLTLREGMFCTLHHGRTEAWRHGLVCAGSVDAHGRYPVIVAVSTGFYLTAARPDSMLFRYGVARRGIFVPLSI